MKATRILSRVAALLLCLTLLPVYALADTVNPDLPVTQSDFDLSLRLHADGFPDDGAAHYQDWQTFLDQVSLKGTINTQLFLNPFSRVGMDASLCLNGKEMIPLEYDGYYSFRYVRSPALDGASVHFQMNNFLEFMLKGYYFMDLPTPLIGLLLYPEAAYYIGDSYYTPVRDALAGAGSRSVSYDDLYALCEKLDLLATEEPGVDPVYFFFTALLVQVGASDIAIEKLSSLETVLEYLDPEQAGMTITAEGERETYVLGETTVFEKDADGWTLTLPDAEGYLLEAAYTNRDGAINGSINVSLDGEDRLGLAVALDGLPTDGQLSAQGSAAITVSGAALDQQPAPLSFAYQYTRSNDQLPYNLSLAVDWLHPQTGRSAVTLSYSAAMRDADYTVLKDRPIDNQDDFFHLNESYMEEYKERFSKTLALAAAPFLLHMPAGCFSDIYTFMDQTGFLAFFGIE